MWERNRGKGDKSLMKPFKFHMSVCPVFREGKRDGCGSKGFPFYCRPKGCEGLVLLKVVGDFRDFLDEVTHFIAKIPVRIYSWAGRWEQSL